MKRSWILVSMLLIALITAGCEALAGNTYDKQIELGYKLVADGKYEEAILAFSKAIEIDVKQAKAYVGLADTYVARGDEKTVEDINDVLKRGYEQSKSVEIADAYLRIADEIVEKGKSDWGLQLLDMGMQITGDNRIRDKKIELIKPLTSNYMNKLLGICRSGDVSAIRAAMASSEFSAASSYSSKAVPVVFMDSGKGVGIYDARYLYYGDFSGSSRVGSGMWLFSEEGYYQSFNGIWLDDSPNGLGKLEDFNGDDSTVFDGMLVNGLWNGKVTMSLNYSNGDTDIQALNYIGGVVQVIETIDGEAVVGVPLVSSNRDGASVSGIRMNEEQTKWKHGVIGFRDYGGIEVR